MNQREADCGEFRMFPKQHGALPYVWLIYLLLPILNLRDETGWKLALGIAMIGLFIVTYRQLYVTTGHVFSFWLGLQMSIIFVFCLFYNPFNMYMGFYTANFIGWFTDNKKFNITLAIFTLVELVPLLFALDQIPLSDMVYTFPFFLIMIASPFGIRSMNRRQRLEKALDQANEQIEALVKREERMRIARDLHDTLGHTLSLITLKSQLVEKLIPKDPERAQLEAREIQNTSRAALSQVRELVSDLRTITVTEALAEAREILLAADIRMHVEGDPRLEAVSDLTQNIVSLCIKEAVTNIVKHSQAKNTSIRIETTAKEVCIEVEDDGIGLRIESDQRGNGLKGMEERLSLIEGSLHLSSSTPSSTSGSESGAQGTRLCITIPLIIKEARKGDESA